MFESISVTALAILVFALVLIFLMVKSVPQGEEWTVERFGRFGILALTNYFVRLMKRIIALLTDFGTEDGYVGAMKGKILSITPLYIQRDDHAKGLFHLLTIASRILALGDYTAKRALAQNNEKLTGVFAGNPQRVVVK